MLGTHWAHRLRKTPNERRGEKMKISRAYIVRGCLQALPATLLCWVAYIKGFILCNTSALVIVLLSLCVSLCMNKKNSKLIVIWVFFFFFYICCFYLDDSHVETRLPWQLLSDVPGGLRCGRKSRFQGLQLLGFYSGPRPASFSDGALLVVLVAARVFIR